MFLLHNGKLQRHEIILHTLLVRMSNNLCVNLNGNIYFSKWLKK